MDFFPLIGIVSLLALCWGSFLNVVAYRIAFDKPFFTPRSHCPSCNAMIAWYDNIPLISWVILRGKCRSCRQPISPIYPFIEGVAGLAFTGLFVSIYFYQPFGTTLHSTLLAMLAPAIMLTALILATATDLHAMIIPQCFSVWLVPLGLMCAYANLLPISITESMIGSIVGYGTLWITGFLFKKATGKEGMGIGDMELLAMIGAFLGPIGVWISLIIGTFSGVILGSLYLFISKQHRTTRIPFAPFLALGACLYQLFTEALIRFFIL